MDRSRARYMASVKLGQVVMSGDRRCERAALQRGEARSVADRPGQRADRHRSGSERESLATVFLDDAFGPGICRR